MLAQPLAELLFSRGDISPQMRGPPEPQTLEDFVKDILVKQQMAVMNRPPRWELEWSQTCQSRLASVPVLYEQDTPYTEVHILPTAKHASHRRKPQCTRRTSSHCYCKHEGKQVEHLRTRASTVIPPFGHPHCPASRDLLN